MPDFAKRADWEARLARDLSRLQQRELKRLIEALGDPPDLNKLTPEFWNEFSSEMRGELLPTLERIFLDSAEEMLGKTSIGVDWALVNDQAARWAETYAYDLVRGINDNSRLALQSKVGAYFRNGLTQQDLRDSLQSLFGPVRAEMISVTEVTRASVAGELALAKEIQKSGISLVPVWNTNNDDIVCRICGPRNQKKQGDGWYIPPPAHPRCRCYLSHEFMEP